MKQFPSWMLINYSLQNPWIGLNAQDMEYISFHSSSSNRLFLIQLRIKHFFVTSQNFQESRVISVGAWTLHLPQKGGLDHQWTHVKLEFGWDKKTCKKVNRLKLKLKKLVLFANFTADCLWRKEYVFPSPPDYYYFLLPLVRA